MPRYTRKPTKKAKRWYAHATLPKSIPVIGGAGFKFGSGELAKRSIKTIARQVVNSQRENKQLTVGVGFSPTHNTIYNFAPLQMVTQGVGASSREGDALFARKLIIRLKYQTIASFSSTVYRVLVVWSPNKYLSNSSVDPTVASGLNSSDLFLSSTQLPVTYQFINNKTSSHILCDKTYVVKPGTNTSQPNEITRDIHCNLFKKLQYNAGTRTFKDENLYVVIMSSTPNGTSGTTNLGNITGEMLMTFAD